MMYILLALGWWSYLLHVKNSDAFTAKSELLIITKKIQNASFELNDFKTDPDFIQLQKKYDRQEKMILGEAFVLAITLLIGIWFINRGYQKQTESARQSRNFLLSITHELKSPIASIKLILQTFKKRNLERKQIEQFSNNALTETERLENLVNNLLLAAKLENVFDIKSEEIELHSFVQNIIENILNHNLGISIINQIEKNTFIFADKFGLELSIQNLIENSIKYNKENPVIQLDYNKDNYFDTISISDNGIGIPNSEKKQVFQKFYRIGDENTRETKGTGLGLYIVKKIIDKHGGKIKLKDNSPKGSIFTIYLPQQKISS